MSVLGLALRAALDGRDFGADAEMRLRTGEGLRWFSLRHGDGDGGGEAILALVDGGHAADEPPVAGIGWQR